MTTSAPRPHSLTANLALFILTPLLMNGVIFGLHWNDARDANPLLPPGWAVGTIWMLLFTLMGLARWRVLRGLRPGLARWIDAVALLCLVYPLYTVGLSNEAIGLAGTVVTAGFTCVAVLKLWRTAKTASGTLLVVLAWLLYAETAMARDLLH